MLRRELPQGQLATYEAGGGSCSVLPPELLNRSKVTVVDIDEDQVRNNTYADEAILGDVQTYSFGRETFDLVICYNVIEHLPHVDAALLNFRDALKPGGMILIGAPNPRSLSGRRHQILAALVSCLVLPESEASRMPACPASRRSRPSSIRW